MLSACGKPVGLDTSVQPLKQIHVLVTSDFLAAGPADGGAALDADLPLDADPSVDAGTVPGKLHAALVWGLQWLPEPFCVLPPESPQAAAVIAAGCRDSFGFVPVRAGADTPITPGVPAILNLYTLPSADVMVGDVTARIAYASVIIYQDTNGNGTLDFRHPQRQRRRRDNQTITVDALGNADVVYGASFISMTLPDRRVAFREGAFNASVAFYPRAGCADPPIDFSILSAGGFSQTSALLNALAGQLPPEDPSLCATATLDDTIVIPLQAPAGLSQLACTTNDSGGVTYYQQPATSPPSPELANALPSGFTSGVLASGAVWACADFPHLPGDRTGPSQGQQLVISSAANAPCRQTLHYSLRGCDTDPFCATGGADVSADPNVLSWWPCSTSP